MEDITKSTYDGSSDKFAGYFENFSQRKEIDAAFNYLEIGSSEPHVLELGCGTGRDASYILERTQFYQGFDYSERLIEIAKSTYPAASHHFTVADMRGLALDNDAYDMIFALAAFLHLTNEELKAMLEKCGQSLKGHGVLCMNFKYAEKYEKLIQQDQFGERVFYLYNPKEIGAMLPKSLYIIDSQEYMIGSKKWFTLYVRKECK